MLQIKAALNYKYTNIEPKDCVVDKVIRLSGAEYERFFRNLMHEWDFLRDNQTGPVIDTEGRYHCLLVTAEGRRDGMLVNTEGAAYARYSALIPDAESMLTAGQYPALAKLNRKLTDITNYIAEQSGERVVIGLEDIEARFDINLEFNDVLLDTVLNMLGERPEIRDVELDKNELILYPAPEQPAEDLSDPSVTQTDMYAYGYGWEGMIPLGMERAVELRFQDHQIYRLYPDGTESAVDDAQEIQSFDGLFGVENPEWIERENPAPVEVFILNREQHEKNKTIGEWLALPADADTLRDLFERIGIDRRGEGAFTITAVRVPQEYLRDHISKYDSLDELNMLASFLRGLEDFECDKLQAILASGVKNIGSGTSALLNTLCEENFDAFRMVDATDYESLGRYWEEELHDKPEELSFEEYGKDIVADEKGKFTEWGYIYFRHKELLPEYKGIVPDEYKIVGAALRGIKAKSQEQKQSGDPTSVLAQIKASRQATRQPGRPKPEIQNKKGVPEL